MTILVGYLPTPEGEAAFDAALLEGSLRSERVVVVNSPRRGAPVDGNMAGTALVDDLLQRAERAGVTAEVRQPLHDDDIARTLEDLVGQEDARLVVIGIRHRTPVGKFLLGSDAQRILLDSTVPVLAVKAAR